MKEPLAIVIDKNGLTLCHPSDCRETVVIARDERGVGGRVAEFIARVNAHPLQLNLFISEDLLFFKVFDLPLDTADLNEAVGYQLEMITPFPDEDILHAFEARKDESAYHVTLYAAKSSYVEAYIQELMESGFHLSGLYPESQRFITRLNRKNQWGLIMPGRFVKAFIFEGPLLVDRLYCSAEPTFVEAVDVCRTDMIFRLDPSHLCREVVEALPPQPYFEYLDACLLLSQRPQIKAYNLLPASYQRPDYVKIVIGVLLLVNLLTFMIWGGVKAYTLHAMSRKASREIEALMPQVTEAKGLRQKEENDLKAIAQIDAIGQGFDLIGFFSKLTAAMPSDSYVDQLRIDARNKLVSIQGYTDDVNGLTAKLQALGSTQLKSTSSRQNKTYFNVEVTLP
ncbi:MAG: hypothetical protein M0Z90_08445 [Desulfobacteraceae bacterium]|nr:hypothetical protein [Desulfobacteraceae bacterium]